MHIARRYPRFGRLLAALAASQLGDWLYNLALLAYVQERTHSPVWLGVTTAARVGPIVVGGPIGGLIADRFDRRRLMFAADIVRAGIMGALVLVALAGLPVALVPVLAGAATLAGIAYPSSVAAVTPRLVAPEDLAAANGARGTIAPACVALGPALGAALLLIGPPAAAFAVNALTFIVSGLLVASIPGGAAFARVARVGAAAGTGAAADPGMSLDAQAGTGVDALAGTRMEATQIDNGIRSSAREFVTELRDGARALRAVREAGWIVAADVAGSVVYGAQTVLLLLVAERLGLGAGGYGYLLAGLGVGGIAGATLAGRLGGAAGRRSTLAGALVLVALPLPLLAVTSSPVLAILAGVVGGAGALVVEVVADTRLQQTLEASRLGCAYGFAFAASVGGIALGGLIAPLLVTLVGVAGALWIVGALVLTLAAATGMRSLLGRVRAVAGAV